jgi:hypothetical protein
MMIDPWEDILSKKLTAHQEHLTEVDGSFTRAADARGDGEWRVASNYLLSTLLAIPPERQTNNHTKRLADVMRNLGWTRKEKVMRIGDVVCRGFVKPETPVLQLSAPVSAPAVISRADVGTEKVRVETAGSVTGVTPHWRRF